MRQDELPESFHGNDPIMLEIDNNKGVLDMVLIQVSLNKSQAHVVIGRKLRKALGKVPLYIFGTNKVGHHELKRHYRELETFFENHDKIGISDEYWRGVAKEYIQKLNEGAWTPSPLQFKFNKTIELKFAVAEKELHSVEQIDLDVDGAPKKRVSTITQIRWKHPLKTVDQRKSGNPLEEMEKLP